MKERSKQGIARKHITHKSLSKVSICNNQLKSKINVLGFDLIIDCRQISMVLREKIGETTSLWPPSGLSSLSSMGGVPPRLCRPVQVRVSTAPVPTVQLWSCGNGVRIV